MTDFIIPTLSRGAVTQLQWSKENNNIVDRGPLTGVTKTSYRAQWHKITITYDNYQSGTPDDASIQGFVSQLKGGANRVWVYDDGYKQRGAFVATELFVNNDFSNSNAGWTVVNATFTVSNRVGRLTATTPTTNVEVYQNVTLTAYVAYVLRAMIQDGAQSAGLNIGVALSDATVQANTYGMARGRHVSSALVAGAGGLVSEFPAVFSSSFGFTAGAYVEVPWCSLSRCLQVDNGPNLLLRSDALDNASWTKGNSTVTANTSVAPDGTTTADAIVEDATATVQHYISQSPARTSQAEDLCAHGYFIRGVGTRNIRIAVGSSSSNYAACTLDLGTGVAGAVSNVGTATNGRAFVTPAGGGWYYFAVVVRAAASATLFTQYDLMSGTTTPYSGNGTSSVVGWRLGAAQSSVPVRPTQTSAVVATGTLQTGGALYVKGGRTPSEGALAGALLRGDRVEIITGTNTSELKILSADLDLDTAGNGYLQFEDPIRNSPADGAAVIINKPMVKCYSVSAPNWPTSPGYWRSYTFDVEEAL